MKKEPKLTPWFKGDVKPVYKGVYERKVSSTTYFYRWTGKCWAYGGSNDPSKVARNSGISHFQLCPWRGLASDPKASA